MDVSEALELISPQVRDLAAYHLEAENVAVKLNQNESPFDWPPEIKEEAARFCRQRPWNRYPDFVPAGLKQALASYAGVTPENVIAGNGSNEMLLVLMLSLADTARKVIISPPTFTVYRLLAQGVGCESVMAPLRDDLSFDCESVCRACEQNPGALCILCSPNNPTGGALSRSQIEAVLDSTRGFVILDQAYVEFGGYNAVELIEKRPNLIITRTFSKAFGAAGMRVGYLLGASAIVEHINKIKLPYNINFFSSHGAQTLLQNRHVMQAHVDEIIARRNDLRSFLQTCAFDAVYSSEANFILVRTRHKEALQRRLRDDGILVRDVSQYPLLHQCLRISVGDRREDALLRKSIGAFFDKYSRV
jgi:histidinol-phosphate aminotransferase